MWLIPKILDDYDQCLKWVIYKRIELIKKKLPRHINSQKHAQKSGLSVEITNKKGSY